MELKLLCAILNDRPLKGNLIKIKKQAKVSQAINSTPEGHYISKEAFYVNK